MLYKKNRFGMKYTRLITGSPVLFVTFILIGLTLFLLLALTTKLDVISTYSAEVRTGASEITLSVQKAETADLVERTAYIYLDKNVAVYPVSIQRIEKLNTNLVLHFNSDDQKMIQALSTRRLFIDIPRGEETLLNRIFVKGGMNHG